MHSVHIRFSFFACAFAVLLSLMLNTAALAGPFALQVDANGVERSMCPVTAEFAVPAELTLAEVFGWQGGAAVLTPGNIPVQVEPVKDDSGKVIKARLHWIEPALKADEKKTYRVEVPSEAKPAPGYVFIDTETTRDLKLGDQLIWRHDVLKHDPAKHVETFKHFHQVYGFHDEGFITQGIDGKQFPHHRGLYIGWNKTVVDGQSYDTWHCTKGVATKHQSFDTKQQTLGNVMARSVSRANWTTGENKTIVTEDRSLATWKVADGVVVLDFNFTLTSGGGDVKLDGDPQHAGFQFRAHGDVGQSKAKYIYADGAKDKGGDVWADCAWVINQFAIKGNPYAVAYFDNPANPGTDTKQTVFSTRNYGRFGAFAKQELKEGSPLKFNYRVLVIDAKVHEGKTQADYQKLYEAWLKPVKVTMTAGK